MSIWFYGHIPRLIKPAGCGEPLPGQHAKDGNIMWPVSCLVAPAHSDAGQSNSRYSSVSSVLAAPVEKSMVVWHPGLTQWFTSG